MPGEPTTWKPPSAHSRSSASTSSISAAIRFALSLTLPAAPRIAPAYITVNRLPPGPAAGNPPFVPPYSKLTLCGSTSKSSASSIAAMVSEELPQNGVE